MMYQWIRSLLFKMEPELSHRLALRALDLMPKVWFGAQVSTAPVFALNQWFSHPVGLAAGLDKNAEHLSGLQKPGFSYIEVGTVTPRPQAGNARPRLFRLPEARAIINRMGFNNMGVDALVEHVQNSDYQGILGINIGKNKDTPIHKAVDDYVHCLQKVYAHASYVTINISSPNTPDLRQLQQAGYLQNLLQALSEEQKKLSDIHQREVPLVVKLSPDEEQESLKRMTADILQSSASGIIATNTTSGRMGVEHLPYGMEAGGLSGAPLKNRATECLRLIKSLSGDRLTLIAAGGIQSIEDAREKLDAGAALLQIYTGLIYQGPWWINKLIRELEYPEQYL